MYRIAICDDDIAYTEYLEKKIKEVLGKSERSSICKYYSGEEFIGDLELEFDLVFLDMQMGEIDGITAAIKFRKRNQDAVLVFCTGIQLPQPEFFDVQPFRYLMKNYTENKMDEELKNIINKMIENKKEVYIVVRNDGRMDKIAIDNITYISNIKRGCCIHMFSKKDNQCYEFASNKKLIDTYEELKNQSFEYAHNSYIVNFKAIIGIKNDVITMEDLTTLNISRSKRKIFHSRFADYLGGKYKRNR